MNGMPDPSKARYVEEGQQYLLYPPKAIPRDIASKWVPIKKEVIYDDIELWAMDRRKQQKSQK